MQVHEHPDLNEPVLLIALEGWIDAGSGAATAMASIMQHVKPKQLVTFDADTFVDFRARRPTMQIRDGVNAALLWPEITMSYGREPGGQDLLLLSGHEPDMAWHRFCLLVRGVALEHGSRMVVGLGAFPIGVPHTRPSLVACTASSDELAASSGLLRNSVDVPAGVTAAVEAACSEAGLPAIGLWAQVPHYATGMPYPGAALALIESLNSLIGTTLPTDELRSETVIHRTRLDELVAQSAEHMAMVQQLEHGFDSVVNLTDSGPSGFTMPSADDLAAEVERFLRDQP
jgi:proteasome assembly chaperone (PAC2) family protein